MSVGFPVKFEVSDTAEAELSAALVGIHAPEQRLGRSSAWTRQQLRFIQAQNPLYRPSFHLSRAYRDPTVPTTQYNGPCHVTGLWSFESHENVDHPQGPETHTCG